MIDSKIKTLLTLEQLGSYTRTAEALSLTQPAVSHHIRMLEEEYGIRIFMRNKPRLKTTPEGEVLIAYARRAVALSDGVRQAIEDKRRDIRSLKVGITPTASDILVPQVLAAYCSEHPSTHIRIIRDTMDNIDNMLASFELDFAIVDGVIRREETRAFLLGEDYLGLVVSPKHPFARRESVTVEEIQRENLVLRPQNAETRKMFEGYITSHGYMMRDFNIIMELDSVSNIKEIVMANRGISILSHNVCLDEEKKGSMVIVPIENCRMVRPINLIYPRDFRHSDILHDIRESYEKHFAAES